MNELTKKLAGQALDKAVSYTWTTLNYQQIQELLACHTELVVRECIAVVQNMSPGYKDYRDQIEDAFRRDCIDEMRNKFSVPEKDNRSN